MKALPWWLKFLVLPIAALVLAGYLIAWIVGAIIHALLYVAVGAIILGVLVWSGRRIKGALLGNRHRRKELRNQPQGASSAPGTPDYLKEFRDIL